mmetsp:Transcript_4971/g.12203  ORF Transcript_4971/g.12203 Transcript_4971/m.12203 type:complete len:262 (-) Transcript_4971:1298-2083(-)
MKKVEVWGMEVPRMEITLPGSSIHCLACEKKEPATTEPKNTTMTWKMKKRDTTDRSTSPVLTAPPALAMAARMVGTSARKILSTRPGTMASSSFLTTTLDTNAPRPGMDASLGTSIRPWIAPTGIMKNSAMSQNSTVMPMAREVRMGLVMPRLPQMSSAGGGAGRTTQDVSSWWCSAVAAAAAVIMRLKVTNADGQATLRARGAAFWVISASSHASRLVQNSSASTFLSSPPPYLALPQGPRLGSSTNVVLRSVGSPLAAL